MSRFRLPTRFLLAVAVLATVLLAPSAAHAVLGGSNGRILFTSGRFGGDAEAKLFLRPTVGSFAGGTTGPTITPTPGVQHKHATWSPDRTRIAYARGTPGSFLTENFDIYVLDITVPGAIPRAITNTADNITSDRPAWSPDGTRIAFDNEVGNNIGQRDIHIYRVNDDAGPFDPVATFESNLTDTPGVVETKAAWTPDSQTIYYSTGNPTAANSMDIVSEPAAGGTVTNIATNPAISEFQPSVSPDGEQICFTRGNGFDNSTDVIVSLANGGGQQILSQDNTGPATTGDINCTWSPNGLKILYTRGIFSSGALVMENSDNSELVPFPIDDVPAVFDGNSDWAPDAKAECEDAAVETEQGQPVEVPLLCLDQGPAYEQTYVQEFLTGKEPDNGTLGELVQGEPATVTYTPNPGFSGTDSFEFNAFDQVAGFATPVSTATITVKPPDIVEPGDGVLGKPVIKAPKKVKAGKKIKAKVNISNTGESGLTGVKVCLKTKKKLVKGKKKRCQTVSDLGPGASTAVSFNLKSKRKKGKKAKLKAVVTAEGQTVSDGHVTRLK